MPTSVADGPGRPPAVLAVDAVVAGYGGPPIIRGVTAQAGLGEIVTVVGPNGAGKSTMLKAVAGLLRVESGSIQLDGRDIANHRTYKLCRQGLGYVPQNDDVFEPLTVRENLEMGGYLLNRVEVKSRIDEVVSILPALERLLGRRAVKLSGGERKMVAVGRALMHKPRVLLLDEPTSGLSGDLSRRLLTEDVRGLAASGSAILLVEQKALAALEISDWGYVLSQGRTAISSSAADLLARSDLGDVFLGQGAAAPPASLEEEPLPATSRYLLGLRRGRR
ncbi:MAG: ABC transporter ATP-binding protein [Actinomycetota bacterium]|nr:ABC transporter ATP-binding protein [Actinomycetota bacterium]